MRAGRYIQFLKNFSFDFVKKKMTDPAQYKKLEAKANEAENLVTELRTELAALRAVVSAVKAASANKGQSYEALLKENESLKKDIASYKQQMRVSSHELTPPAANGFAPETTKVTPDTKEPPKSAPASKSKPPKEKKPQPKPTGEELPVDFGRLYIRVGKIIDVKKHPDADSLYVEQIEVGEEKPRTVISGLVKFVPIEKMQNRMVLVLCNLKPAKMRGILSEAMVMCASTPEKVEILTPPEGAVPGDVVEVDGYARCPDAVLNPKQKIFEAVAPDLRTDNDKMATYKGVRWAVPGKGTVSAETLSGVNIK